MKRERKILLFLLLFFASGALAFGYTKVKAHLSQPTRDASQKKLVFINEPAVLGSFLKDTLPEVKKTDLASPSAQPQPNALQTAGETLAQETAEITKSILNNVTEAVREAVVKNISINQEKIVQDITAQLLQNLLSQVSTTSQPVDRAVYEACTSIIKKAETTPTPTPTP